MQCDGESAQLIGIRNRLQRVDIELTSISPNTGVFLPLLSEGDKVTNTISTTRSTSGRPRVFKSSSSKFRCICAKFLSSTNRRKSKWSSSGRVGERRVQAAPASRDRATRFAAMPLSPMTRWTCPVQSTDVSNGTDIVSNAALCEGRLGETRLWEGGCVLGDIDPGRSQNFFGRGKGGSRIKMASLADGLHQMFRNFTGYISPTRKESKRNETGVS